MKKILLILVFLFGSVMNWANNDTIRIRDESILYIQQIGDDTNLYDANQIKYHGKKIDNHFNEIVGFWDNTYSALYTRKVSGSLDTSYYCKNDFGSINEITSGFNYIKKFDWLLEDHQGISGHVADCINELVYNSKTKKWNVISHNLFESESQYDVNGYHPRGESVGDVIFEGLLYAIIFALGIYMLVHPLYCKRKDTTILIHSYYDIGVYAILGILTVILLHRNLQIQVITIILLAIIPYLLGFLIFVFKKSRKRIYYCSILVCMIYISLGVYQNCILKDSVTLEDGYRININWQKGTDIIKRNHIKGMLKKLQPYSINLDCENYTLYLMSEPFSWRDLDFVTDEIGAWLSGNSYCTIISFREVQLLKSIIYKTTNVQLDLPSIPEWECLNANKSIVDIGYGDTLYEYTDNYLNQQYRPNLSADTVLPLYDYVLLYGINGKELAYKYHDGYILKNLDEVINAFDSTHSVKNTTFRFAFRPNSIGSRTFVIHGRLRNDIHDDSLPNEIILTSINGVKISEMPDYETFQEKLIESRFESKELDFIDAKTNNIIHRSFPKGLEVYDFFPVFDRVK